MSGLLLFLIKSTVCLQSFRLMESFRSRSGSSAILILLVRHRYVSSNFDYWTHTCGGPRGLLKPHSLNCISGGQPEDLLQAIVDSVDPTETCPFLASFDKVYDIVSCSNSCVTHRSHLHLAVQYTVYFPVHSQSRRPFSAAVAFIIAVKATAKGEVRRRRCSLLREHRLYSPKRLSVVEYLLVVLGSKVDADVRRSFEDTFARFMPGDTSMIEDIRMKGERQIQRQR